MATFPFVPFSYNNYYNHFYPRYYNRNRQNISNTNNQNIKEEVEIETNQEKDKIQENQYKNQDNKYNEDKNKENQKRSTKYNSFANFNLSALLESDLNTPVIEILGIKLYLDDLIIIGLLFFLYKEDVQDEILFGILLLLLLS